MTSHSRIADVLDAAADYIEQHGLARGLSIGPDGKSRCSVAACNEGSRRLFNTDWLSRPPEAAIVANRAIDVLRKVAGVENIVQWSDESPVQEVLDAFRLAAKQERILDDAVTP